MINSSFNLIIGYIAAGIRSFPSLKHFAAVTFLFAVSLLTVWHILILGYIPETPAQDLAKHVASILNFKDAFFDGQYLPRLQLPPAQIPDLPVFQFYGSLTGFLCMPFLLLGFAPVTALTLGILLIRWVGAIAIHKTGRLLGANSWCSSLAAAAYLLTPYMISNFYGRVAIPEATAHGVIAILFYGLIRLYQRPDGLGVAVIGLAIVALSLSHPIFLLFGCIVAAFFSLLLLRVWFLALMGCVFIGGMLLASFQWLPGFLYHGDFATNFTSVNPFYQNHLTSYSGLYWWPRSLAEEQGRLEEARLFLTPGIFSLPMLFMLAVKIKQPLCRATFGTLLLVLIASYSPFNLWKFGPEFLWALQFPYRLLAIVALLTSISLCLTLKDIRPSHWAILVTVLFLQNAGILLQKPYSVRLAIGNDDKAVGESFANQDYTARSNLPLQLVAGDGWLLHYADNVYDAELQPPGEASRLVDANGILLSNNSFLIGASKLAEKSIRVHGSITNSVMSSSYRLRLFYSDEPLVPLGEAVISKSGKFDVLFKNPNNARSLTVQCRVISTNTPPEEQELECPNISLSKIESLPGNGVVVSQETSEPTNLNIKGASIFQDGPVDLWLASPYAPEQPVSDRISVGPGKFSASLLLPGTKGVYMIVASRYFVPAHETPGSQDYRRLSVSVSTMNQSSKDSAFLEIPFTDVLKIASSGYMRVFKVKDTAEIAVLPIGKSVWKIQLPMAFSPMIEVTQNNIQLNITPTDRGLIYVQTSDQLSPIVARFRWPPWILVITFIGFILLVMLAWRVRQILVMFRPVPPGRMFSND